MRQPILLTTANALKRTGANLAKPKHVRRHRPHAPRSPSPSTGPSSSAALHGHVASIVAAASRCVADPASSRKLAGTALTLLGGMAPWFATPAAAQAVQAAAAAAGEELKPGARAVGPTQAPIQQARQRRTFPACQDCQLSA